MKVAFLTNIPSPYRVSFFNELGKYCELTVFFERSMSDERDKSWGNYEFKNFSGIILKGKNISTDKSFAPSIKKYLKSNKFDHVVVCNSFTPTGIYAIFYMKKNNIDYCIEGDGAFVKKENFLKKLFKKSIIKGAKGYFSTSKTHDEYYLTYGAEKNLIFRYPFTSVMEENVLDSPLDTEDKNKIKISLGINEERMILSVGQFVYRKGFDVLLKAVRNLDKSIGVYIIGGNPTSDMESFVCSHNLSNVHFLSFKKPEELRQYYKVADVFVLPTREDIWGLVVNEAMAVGTPVIATDKCVSGLEMIKNGLNGYIVPSENEVDLSNTINMLMDNNFKRMSEESLETAKKYTIQNMARTHINILSKI
ncbi:MAG: glycosyltransferase [Oscillospiraceae bacterium]|nr:glycosyltransferase [Oscillospiraceae bacterium]